MPWRILLAALTARRSYPAEGVYMTEHVTITAIYALTLICVSAFTALTILSLYDQAVPTALWSMPGACVGALAAFLARGKINVRPGDDSERASVVSGTSGVLEQGPGPVSRRD
jgi:hypothetical protein